MRKAFIALVILLLGLPLSAATKKATVGDLFTSCDTVTSTGACDAALYMKPASYDTLPTLHTWTVLVGGTGSYSALSVKLEGSVDGSNWFTMDTATTAGGRTVSNTVVQYARCNPATLTVASGSPTLTCSFISSRPAGGTVTNSTALTNTAVLVGQGGNAAKASSCIVADDGTLNCSSVKVGATVQAGRVDSTTVLMGDSITNHFTDTTNYFVGQLVTNKGTSGNTCTQVQARFAADAANAGTVHILCGTNDMWSTAATDKTTGTYQTNAHNAITAMVIAAKAAGQNVILGTVTPVRTGMSQNVDAQMNANIVALNTWIRTYAASNNLRLVDYYYALLGADSMMPAAYTYDGVHPTDAGYAVMYAALSPFLPGSVAQGPRGGDDTRIAGKFVTYNYGSPGTTDSEFGQVQWVSNGLDLATYKTGAGSERAVRLKSDMFISFGSKSAINWYINPGTKNFYPGSDATFDLCSATARCYNLFMSQTAFTPGVGMTGATEPTCMSGTDLVVDAATNTKVTSATHNFIAADVGRKVEITAGAGWTVGNYYIRSVASNAATLSSSPAAVGTTGGNWNLNRGLIVAVEGAAGAADTLRVCSKDAANAYAWRALY